MPQSLSQLYIHLIFSTKDRIKVIDESIEKQLWKLLGGTLNSSGSQIIKVGGHMDHVHILFDLHRTATVADTVEIIKTTSSKWMKIQHLKYESFYWQDGYAAFSVSPKNVEGLIKYIENQNTHHIKQSFKEECRRFFKENQQEYDERYVWD